MEITEKNSQLDTLEREITAHLAAVEAMPEVTGGSADYIRALQYAARIVKMEIGFVREAQSYDTPADCEDCQTTAGCRCNEGNR
jgi:hypothetical protein